MSHLIDLDVAFYRHLTWQFDSAHVKCDVSTRPYSVASPSVSCFNSSLGAFEVNINYKENFTDL